MRERLGFSWSSEFICKTIFTIKQEMSILILMKEILIYGISTLALICGVGGMEEGAKKWIMEKDLVIGPLLVITGGFSILFACSLWICFID